jgi:membrane-bound ClpP family serine protease
MSGVGLVLAIAGTALVVAEMHAPSVVLGVSGAMLLILGAVLLIVGLGAGAVLVIAVAVALLAAASTWLLAVMRTASRSRGTRAQAGAEALCGRDAVVRRWGESAGQVFLDGALWRARHDWPEPDEESFHEGEAVVVERVSGLTLSVRRAEEWELIG